jgi:hypothetical protein
MNYQFLFANRDFFAEGKASLRVLAAPDALYNSYVPQVSRNMMNLLRSHDTPRFLTVANNNEDLHRLAARFNSPGLARRPFTTVKTGNARRADPDNRRGMEWNLATPNEPDADYYKKLIRVRNASRALQSAIRPYSGR